VYVRACEKEVVRFRVLCPSEHKRTQIGVDWGWHGVNRTRAARMTAVYIRSISYLRRSGVLFHYFAALWAISHKLPSTDAVCVRLKIALPVYLFVFCERGLPDIRPSYTSTDKPLWYIITFGLIRKSVSVPILYGLYKYLWHIHARHLSRKSCCY